MFEAVHAKVDTRILTIKFEENNDPEGLEKGATDAEKLMKTQTFVSDGPL